MEVEDQVARTMKHGRYSKSEKKKIFDHVELYMKERNLDTSAVCSLMREETPDKTNHRLTLWAELESLLPYRTKRVGVYICNLFCMFLLYVSFRFCREFISQFSKELSD